MKLQGKNVIVTGASGGLGVVLARALARRGAHLALAARSQGPLEQLRDELTGLGVRAVAIPCDLTTAEGRARLIEGASEQLGPVDVLVNNAVLGMMVPFHKQTPAQLHAALTTNLRAPVALTRALLPGMLERGRGHIMNIGSLAGKSGPSCHESYSAAKAGLVAFTHSLRGTYRARGVSASIIVPGLIGGTGFVARYQTDFRRATPWLLGTSDASRVADAMVRAIESDTPERIINPRPVRWILVLSALFPRLGERLAYRLGANHFFDDWADNLEAAPQPQLAAPASQVAQVEPRA